MEYRDNHGRFKKGFSRGPRSNSVKEKISKANSGIRNGMYRGGKPNCRVCGIEVSYSSLLCKKHVDRSYLHTKEFIENSTERLIKLVTNEKTHPRWKGEKVGYVSLHKWVQKHKGKPSKCEFCGTEENRRYEWAHIKDKLGRNLDNWIRLCVSCHRKYDDIGNKVWIKRRLNDKKRESLSIE